MDGFSSLIFSFRAPYLISARQVGYSPLVVIVHSSFFISI